MMFHYFLRCALLFLSAYTYAGERIILFDADIQVHKNGTQLVKEAITVHAAGRDIRHGIVREFPTTYWDRSGIKYVVDFKIKEILLDGQKVSYNIHHVSNGTKIYLGNPKAYLAPGQHTFTITYQTNRQLGSFDDHDELYWNVTGNGWRLPIDQARVNVTLPKDIILHQITFDAFTGLYGHQGSSFKGAVLPDGTISITTTRHLQRYEGFTIVVGWPKGHIDYPGIIQQIIWFAQDNAHIIIFFIGLFLIILIMGYIYRKNQQLEDAKPAIPLFYPPQNMSAGAMSYIIKHGYSHTAFAAEIMSMAVHQWLTITYTPGYLYGGTYTLTKSTQEPTGSSSLYTQLRDRLFKSSDSIKLTQKNARTITSCQKILASTYQATYGALFDTHLNEFFLAGIIAALSVFGIALATDTLHEWLLIPAGIYAFIICLGYMSLKSYTQEGMTLKREIDGFKLFLATTETERLKIIGTPPTKTPELYEEYLPYATALGVEKQWNQQFASVFAHLAEQGKPYTPIWFIGPRNYHFSPGNFSSQLGSSMSSAISSSGSRPGGSSGFGGGGRSGGGGGGGGGGGW